MLEVRRYFISFLLNDVEYPIERNVFERLMLISNKRVQVPTCEITFYDTTGDMKRYSLGDSTKLTIRVGRSAGHFDTYNYRVYNYQCDPTDMAPRYTITGIYDCPAWFNNSWRTHITGTSSEAITTLANTCNLRVDADQTNDTMNWLPANKRVSAFAEYIAARGYVDEKSGMVLGMTLDGKVLYKNLSNLPTTGTKFAHGNIPGTINVLDARQLNGSGHDNLNGGYNHSVTTQSILKDVAKRSSMDIKRVGQFLSMGKHIKDVVKAGKIVVSAINVGNVHDMWEQATYQNSRVQGAFSSGIELLIDTMTDSNFDLFSCIEYQAAQTRSLGFLDASVKGTFYVTAKVIYIEQGNYFQKIQAYTNSVNADPQKLLI